MRFVTETITPARAANLLLTNGNNRQVSPKRVDSFARDMMTNNWRLNPQPIVLNDLGHLKDGQHRLMAVVQADVPVDFVVCYDAEDSTQEIIDRVRPRQFRDTLKMEGKKSPKQVAATSRNLLVFLNSYKNSTVVFTEAELRVVVDKYEKSFEWCGEAPRKPNLSRAAYFAVLVYAHQAFPNEVAAFHEAVQTGVNLTNNHPALHLRNWMQNKFRVQRTGSQIDLDIMKRTASSLEAYLSGRPVQKVHLGMRGTTALKGLVANATAQAAGAVIPAYSTPLVQIRRNGHTLQP